MVSQTLLFGKGMGDLPEALRWLRPVAVTGIVERVLPSRSGNKAFTLNDDGDLDVVPINERTGRNVGIRGQIYFFLDDLFPTTIGRPLFK